MTNPTEILENKDKLVDMAISGACYNISKKIRELFVNLLPFAVKEPGVFGVMAPVKGA